ncbi:MAG: hypothetical protein AAFW98_19810, partial [Pseudomonadota bacterium]
SETALLIEAGVQAAAAEVLAPMLAEPASLDELVERGSLDRGAVPLATRLLLALEASDHAQDTEGRWQITGEAMDVADVVALISTEHPERLAEAAMLAAMPTWFAAAFRGGLSEAMLAAEPLLAQLATDAPFSAPIYDALKETLVAIMGRRDQSALRLCIVGARNIGFLRAVAALVDEERVRLVVTDRDATTAERLALVWEPTPGVEIASFAELTADPHPYDAMLLTPSLGVTRLDGLKDLLKPGGALIGAAYGPALFVDALCGLTADWWAGSADPEEPVGRLMNTQEWTDALADVGLTPATVAPLASGDADAILWSAAREAANPIEEALQLPSLHAVGEAARKVCVALSAMQEERP